MAGNAWDRAIINTRERPVSSDINTAQSQLDRTVREALSRLFSSRVSGSSDLAGNPPSGFLGDSFKVRPPVASGLSLRVAAGLGFQYLPGDVPAAVGGVPGLDDLSAYKPLPLLAEATISGIPAGPNVGQDRYDIVEVRMNRVVGNPLSRDTLNTLTGVFTSGLVNKTLAFPLDGNVGVVTSPANSTAAISYKVGTAAGVGSAVVPATTPGYQRIAIIFSKNGNMLTGITRANIIDTRPLLAPDGMMSFAASFSVPSGPTSPPTAVALRAPSGIEIAVNKTAGGLNNQFEVFLIGGDVPTGGNMVGTIMRSTVLSTEFFQLQPYGGVNIGTLNATQVADLQNASITGPALVFCEGQPYMSQKFYGSRANIGTVDGAIPDPATINVQGTIQRY